MAKNSHADNFPNESGRFAPMGFVTVDAVKRPAVLDTQTGAVLVFNFSTSEWDKITKPVPVLFGTIQPL